MNRLVAAVLLALAGLARAGDPVHTEKDLAPDLRELAWLLGNWEGKGVLAGTDFNEFIRFWPSADGRVLYERAWAADTSGAVIHDDRMAIWKDAAGLRCNFYEADPPRLTEFDLAVTKEGLRFVPRAAGGPALTFTRKENSGYAWAWAAKAPDGSEIRATGESARAPGDFATFTPDPPAASLKPVLPALETFEGTYASAEWEGGDGVLAGEAILGGDVLELSLLPDSGKLAGAEIRAWLWYDGNAKTWTGSLINTRLGVFPGDVAAAEGAVTFTADGGATVFRWSWRQDHAELHVCSAENGRETERLTFSGKRPSGD